jgi:hypothetical protein
MMGSSSNSKPWETMPWFTAVKLEEPVEECFCQGYNIDLEHMVERDLE